MGKYYCGKYSSTRNSRLETNPFTYPLANTLLTNYIVTPLHHFTEYCGIHLTHDSVAVRRAHNGGWKHRSQVQIYYAGLSSDKLVGTIAQIQQAYVDNHGAKAGMAQLQTDLEKYLSEKQIELTKMRIREREKKQRSMSRR